MFRFVLVIAFLRRVLQLPFIRLALAVTLCGALVVGLMYAVLVFHAVDERSQTPYVRTHGSH
jgi:hypothetical protein